MKHTFFLPQSGRKRQYFGDWTTIAIQKYCFLQILKEGEGFLTLQMPNSAMYLWQKSTVFVVMFSNWYCQTVYPRFKGDEFNVYRATKYQPHLICSSFLIMVISKYLVLHDPNYRKEPKRNSPYSRNFQTNRWWWKDAVEKQLSKTKENSEHVMLVDLARNDLSRNGHDVKVEKIQGVQFFSHVIHLVSKVSGYLHEKRQLCKW
jgi:anthranilate synthase component 1